MVRLIYFEFCKQFKKPSIFLALLVFSLLSIFKIDGIYAENALFARSRSATEQAQIKQLYWDFYQEFEGKITLQKINRLLAVYRPLEEKTADLTASTDTDNSDTYTGNVYNDYHFFHRGFVLPMEYAYLYQSYASKVVLTAQENMSFYQSVNNTYDYRKNAAIANRFLGRQVQDFAFTELYQYYLCYDFSSFLALLIMVYGLVGVFASEKEVKMDILLQSVRYGSSKTIAAKLLVAALFITAVSIWLGLVDFLAFSAMFGTFKGMDAPLYAIKSFADTALNITLGQYALLAGVVKTGGLLVLGLFVLLLSSLFKNVLFPFILSFIGLFGCIYWQQLAAGFARIEGRLLNPLVLLNGQELFGKMEFVNLFGFPVPSYLLAMLAAGGWGSVATIILFVTMPKNTALKKGVQKNES